MGVYINGMEMQKVAGRMEAVITILKDGTAQIAISPADDGIGYWKEYPLIFVPPHGRLIDADELEKKFCSHCDDYMSGKDECKEGCFDLKIIKSMPTVIPADKDGET